MPGNNMNILSRRVFQVFKFSYQGYVEQNSRPFVHEAQKFDLEIMLNMKDEIVRRGLLCGLRGVHLPRARCQRYYGDQIRGCQCTLCAS